MRRPWGAALVAAVSSLALLLPTAGGAVARDVKVDHRIFGMHDASMTSLKSSHLGSLRLWDAGVDWSQIETGYDPTTGAPIYDWSRLDSLVAAARAKHVEITLVLGQTPSKYSNDPAVLPMNPVAGAENPAVQAFRAYVNAVMARYGSKIAAYQVWNEANVVDYWKGTPAQMAKLTQIVYQARNDNAPHSLVVSPAFATRLGGQRAWIKKYAHTRVSGTPVWRYLNAAALNLYPMARAGGRVLGPEDSITLLRLSRILLVNAGWPTSMPVWNTEVNYGIETGHLHGKKAQSISSAHQAANVIRTYALNAANGVKRVFWYRWDLAALPGGGALGNTVLTKPGSYTKLTPAGKAFVLVQSWLHGRLLGASKKATPCAHDKRGTYTCEVKYASGVGRIYWNPTRTVKVTVVPSAKKVQNEFGHTTSIKGGSTRKVNYQPILVRSRS